jgi:hypothetical protein
MISKALHTSQVEEYIKKRVGWTSQIFQQVDLEAHSQAISTYKRVQQLRLVKLSHGLYHTNYEAKKIYGQSDLCPCCKTTVKTLQHVFCCPNKVTTTNREAAKQQLKSSLLVSTPVKLVQMLLHGIHQWELVHCGKISSVSPLFRRSVSPVDTLLILAFQSQTSIGWDQLLSGRLSSSWGTAYKYIVSSQQPVDTPTISWAKTVISHQWTYSITLWKFRNGVVHGHTVEAAKTQEFLTLQARIWEEYAQYQVDQSLFHQNMPFCLPGYHVGMIRAG